MKSKSAIFSLLFVFCMSFFTSVPMYSKNKSTLEKTKIYIKKNALEIQDDMIALVVDDNLIPIDAVYCDEQGLYVYTTSLLSKGHNGQWYCRKCREYHGDHQECDVYN